MSIMLISIQLSRFLSLRYMIGDRRPREPTHCHGVREWWRHFRHFECEIVDADARLVMVGRVPQGLVCLQRIGRGIYLDS